MRLSVPTELLKECGKKEIQLFLMILSKSSEDGKCSINTDYMCLQLGVQKSYFSKLLSRICERNLVEKISTNKETFVQVVNYEKYTEKYSEETIRKLLGNYKETITESKSVDCIGFGNYQETIRKLLGNYQETIRKLLGNYQETITESKSVDCIGFGNYQETIRKLLGNYQAKMAENGQISDKKLCYYIDVLSFIDKIYNINNKRYDNNTNNLLLNHSHTTYSNDLSVCENFTGVEKNDPKEETPNEQLSLFEKEEKTCGQKEEKINTKDILEYWNNKVANTGIKKIAAINAGSTRERQTICRIREYGINKFTEAINNAAGSAYLRGQSWFCYDWFVKPNNFPKVLEDNYRDNNTNDNGNIQRERRWGFCGDVTEYDDELWTDIECPGEQFPPRPTTTDNPTDG